MGTLFVDNIKHESAQGSGTITLGASGETIALASGASVSGNGLVGITMTDQWRITANITANADPISANLERNDTAGFGKIGTGMSVSSGIWTFPSTGLYEISCTFRGEAIANDNLVIGTYTTTDDSTYIYQSVAIDSGDGSSTGATSASSNTFFNVTNTSTHKVKFTAESITSGSYFLGSTSDINNTYFTFIRLGDSV